MKKELIVRLKNEAKIQFEPFVVSSTSKFIDVSPMFSELNFPLLLKLNHEGLTTTLDLSNLPDCLLIHLDDSNQFSGATYCINKSDGTFSIQAQSKTILFIPFPAPFSIEEITSIHVEPIN